MPRLCEACPCRELRARRDVLFCTWPLDSGEVTLHGADSGSELASDDIALIKYTHLNELRWPTLATLALCTFLPGCPMVDNYFIDTFGGAGPTVTGGSAVNTAGTLEIVGRPDTELNSSGGTPSGHGGSHAGGATVTAGSVGTTAGTASTTAGKSNGDAGSGDAGSPSEGLGGAGGSSAGSGGTAGQDTSAGGRSGSAGTAGNPPNLPDPACKEGVTKGTTCSGAGAQLCYKSCGPDNVGYKPLTCQGGMYDELQSGCTFPTSQDYGCYAVPQTLPTDCPAGMPRGGQPCQIASCIVCFGGTSFAPQYQDSTGTQKNGYCVCSQAGVWTCGTYPEAWPCSKAAGPGPGPGQGQTCH